MSKLGEEAEEGEEEIQGGAEAYIYTYIDGMYVHTFVYTCSLCVPMDIHTYICINIRLFVCLFIFICLYIYIYVCIYIYIYLYIYVYIYIYICIHIHMYIYIYFCIYTCIEKNIHVHTDRRPRNSRSSASC